MTTLKHRKISFKLDENIPFYWNPENLKFSREANSTSFAIVAFEKYLVRTMNSVIPLTNDPVIKTEAKALLEQEARHSAAHQRHVNIICSQYPELSETLPKLNAHYDELFKTHSLKFNLAFVANIELMFTPLATIMIDNRERFFSQGDPNISSLFLWHCMEEIEHRNSAVQVYNALFGNPWYRLVTWPTIYNQMKLNAQILQRDFRMFVSTPEHSELKTMNRKTRHSLSLGKRIDNFKKFKSILRTQLPFYDPVKESIPEFAQKWFESEAAGEDMSCFYGKKTTTLAQA